MSTSGVQLLLDPLVVPGPCRSVVERWKSVARSLPDRPAIHSPGVGYTFAEADALSDGVAAGLLEQMPDDDLPVALYVDHNAEALIGLLAIVKTGRIIVFLDPHVPADRLRQIRALAGSTTCLADSGNAAAAGDLGEGLTTVIRLDQLIAKAGGMASGQAGRVLAGAPVRSGTDPVAIVFTSGSTGRPKGVVQTHDLVLGDTFGCGGRLRICPDDRVALVLPYGFAAGFYVFFISLLNGAGVWSFDPREHGTAGLVSWIDEQRLTMLVCTPYLLRSVVATLTQGHVLESVRLAATLGEAVYATDVLAIRPHLPEGASFVNWTGSSEMGTLALHEIAGDDPVPPGPVPAGRPIANKTVSILLDDGTPAPTGESGQLLAISHYLSTGYWKDPERTAARFSVQADGRRVCRQGDLGRIDGNGDLTLLGRADAAVKVRGYLVEPSEVEAAILAADGVKDVVVVPVVDQAASTRLIAYVVPHADLRTESPAALRRRLRTKLPEYMVPSAIVPLARLPRNERGKVDRSALPPVPPPSPAAAPSGQREIVIADLWAEVLGVESVGRDDDFMSMGGDSLSVEEMLTVVAERFQVALVSTDLVEAPTLAEFTRRVVAGRTTPSSHPDVVTLQSGTVGTPLFCFAGSGALALTFVPLSRHFRDRPVHAFQAHGLERRAMPDWSIQSAARRYLEIIRVLQPHGPYILLGHSFGGLVALETARLLTDANETVELVGLLDTYLPRSFGQPPTPAFEPMAERPAVPTLFRKAADVLQKFVGRLLPDGLPKIRQWNRQGRAYLAGVITFSGQRQFDAFFDHGVLTTRRYRLLPYAGRTLVVLADNNPDGSEAWKPFLTGEHKFLAQASEHSSLLREPHATELAVSIRAEIAPVSV